MNTSFSPISFKAQTAIISKFPTADNAELKGKNEALQAERLEPKVVEPKKEKTGLVQGFKNMVSAFKKGWVNLAEYTSGTVKGLFNGLIAAGGVYVLAFGHDKIKNIGKEAAHKLAETPGFIKHTVAGIAFLSALCISWYNSSLNVSEKSAKIDHRYNTGHMNK